MTSVDDLSTTRNLQSSENVVPHVFNQQMEINNNFGNKYKAFGQFLSSSLIEMNEIQALNLVEKFTTELVKYMKTEERKKSFTKVTQNNNDDDDENSLTVY